MEGQRSNGVLSKTSHLQECNVLLWEYFGPECTLDSGQDACLFWPTVRLLYKGMIHVRFTWANSAGRLALHLFLSLKASVLGRAGLALPRSQTTVIPV